MVSATENIAQFTETITDGIMSCANGGIIIITKIDNNYITYSYFLPGTKALDSFSTLQKSETDVVSTSSNCDNLFFDPKKGTMSGILPTASMQEIMQQLPCYTGSTEEGGTFNCGGGVFFLDHDFFFYSHRDYIEVRSGFDKTDVAYNLLGNTRKYVENTFGKPDKKFDSNTYLYKMEYGTLRIEFTNNLVKEIGAHGKYIDDVELCR